MPRSATVRQLFAETSKPSERYFHLCRMSEVTGEPRNAICTFATDDPVAGLSWLHFHSIRKILTRRPYSSWISVSCAQFRLFQKLGTQCPSTGTCLDRVLPAVDDQRGKVNTLQVRPVFLPVCFLCRLERAIHRVRQAGLRGEHKSARQIEWYR